MCVVNAGNIKLKHYIMGTAQKKYDLCWIVSGVCKEVLERNKFKKDLAWLKLKLENSTHKMGKLVYMETGTHNY